MRHDNCRLDPEELVAWREGTLDPERSADVTVHVGQCPVCQQRVEIAEDADAAFEQSWPLVSDQDGERRTIAALYGYEPIKAGTRRLAIAMITVFILPVFAVMVLWPPPTAADSGITGLVNIGRQHVGQIIPEGSPMQRDTLTGIPREREYAVPEELPLGLELVDRDDRGSDGLFLHYTSDDLEILVSQVPVETPGGYIATDDPGYLLIKGVHIAYLKDPRPDAVASMIWERNDIQFALMALQTPRGADGGLPIDDAVEIVHALFEVQDTGASPSQ